jgi:hypothetical protein
MRRRRSAVERIDVRLFGFPLRRSAPASTAMPSLRACYTLAPPSSVMNRGLQAAQPQGKKLETVGCAVR